MNKEANLEPCNSIVQVLSFDIHQSCLLYTSHFVTQNLQNTCTPRLIFIKNKYKIFNKKKRKQKCHETREWICNGKMS
jgi:hypothetical protein